METHESGTFKYLKNLTISTWLLYLGIKNRYVSIMDVGEFHFFCSKTHSNYFMFS